MSETERLNSFLAKVKKFTDNSLVDEILIFAVIVAIIETLAQNTLKQSSYGTFKFILGLFFYLLVGYFLHYAYHNVPLGKLNVTWSCFSIIIAITLGYILYDEHLDKNSVIAVFFAFLAIYFANISTISGIDIQK